MVNAPRILVAGCDESDVQRVRDALADLVCEIRTVAIGAECLYQLQRFQPHLVLLDSGITNPDAFDLCRRIKNDHTAVVIMCGELQSLDDIDRLVGAETDDFVPKPVSETETRRRIVNLLRLQQKRR